jgi:hypothetical protein
VMLKRKLCYMFVSLSTMVIIIIIMSRNSPVNIVSRLRIGLPGVDSWQGQGFCLLATVSRPGLGTTQPLIQRVPRVLSLGVKRPGREGSYSHPSFIENV